MPLCVSYTYTKKFREYIFGIYCTRSLISSPSFSYSTQKYIDNSLTSRAWKAQYTFINHQLFNYSFLCHVLDNKLNFEFFDWLSRNCQQSLFCSETESSWFLWQGLSLVQCLKGDFCGNVLCFGLGLCMEPACVYSANSFSWWYSKIRVLEWGEFTVQY